MTALLLYGDTERSSAMRHEVPAMIIDPFMFVEVDGRKVVLTSDLERDRIARALPRAELLDVFALGFLELIKDGLSYERAEAEVVLRALRRLEISDTYVPGTFPVLIADLLRAAGIAVTVDDEAVNARRRAKSGAELDGIRTAQRAAESGMAAAAVLLAGSEPRPDGRLYLDGERLTAELVRAALRTACAAAGAPCPPDVMVGSAWQGYGHDPGAGPLPAGLPIVIDLWPRHEETGCWADMTRTFIVGDPAPECAAPLGERERLVRTALEEARAAVRPGVTGGELYGAAADLFEAAGFPTRRTSAGTETRDGFQFALGHGVGLDIHEAPDLGPSGSSPLVEGDVIAVEPGLWDARLGEVRFEDLLLVTEDGCETLTRYPYDLRPSG
jgi:Xaa-Pro aminopeptidase